MIMFGSPSPMEQRIKKLQSHLSQENPVLLDVVKSFRQLDRVAYRLGILDRDESFTTRVPWWPMVSILGTFSSGKSTFINGYLDTRLQNTGNQAVDDKFTVICYGAEEGARVLPGRALDADQRFPFYQMSHAIEEVAPGEGERKEYFEAEVDVWRMFCIIARERKRREIAPAVEALAECEERTKRLTGADAKEFNALMKEIGEYMKLFDAGTRV